MIHGVVHAEQGNILIDDDSHVKLVDFGLSNFVDVGDGYSSGVRGAKRCSAPEIILPDRYQIKHVHHTDFSDMYSFGQVFWQASE